MDQPELLIFADLFRDVCAKCFRQPLEKPLSEPESRYLSDDITEKTGLVVGWKSIKNYAAYITSHAHDKHINPSAATLDTLARYLADAPVIAESQRKKHESSYPYWFAYRELRAGKIDMSPGMQVEKPTKRLQLWGIAVAIVMLGTLLFWYFQKPARESIAENFQHVEERILKENGWFVVAKDTGYWRKRDEKPGQLTLFTLQGDNWRTKHEKPAICNLLTRKITGDCFSAEVHFKDFIPHENWQQAGLLLMEDTAFSGKSIRLSIAYNDFFGGYTKPGEIIIQTIASYGGTRDNVEEITHQVLFTLDGQNTPDIIANNLRNAAVRIEKQGRTLRFLYAASPVENFSFKELAVYEFDINAQYAGVFALKGFVDSAAVLPVAVNFFGLEQQSCK